MPLKAACYVNFVNFNDTELTFIDYPKRSKVSSTLTVYDSAFGGLEVACWPLVPKFAGSNPAEAVGFFRLRRGSKAVGPMS